MQNYNFLRTHQNIITNFLQKFYYNGNTRKKQKNTEIIYINFRMLFLTTNFTNSTNFYNES